MNPLAALLKGLSPRLWACAMCFGAKGSSPAVIRGIMISGAILLVCVFSILMAFGRAIWVMEKRKAAVDGLGERLP